MYTYNIVKVKHSAWTGKPTDNIEDIIAEYAADGWRLVQVLQDHAAMSYQGRVNSKIIFEKKVPADFYQNARHQNDSYSEQGFV